MNGQELMNGIEKVMRACGKRILDADRSEKRVEAKEGVGNFVTYYDKLNQEELRKGLMDLLPEAVFVGEEEDVHAQIRDGYSFIVDPIDGTMNFIRDQKASAVSVGLLKDGKPYIGMIYNPYRDEMFKAERGQGAFLNGERIHVSDRSMSEAIIYLGTGSYYTELYDVTYRYSKAFFERGFDFRRSGSVAIDLCDLAAGRGEVCFESRLQPWDYAAAAAIVEEAGGKISQLDFSPLNFGAPCSVLARGAGINDSDLIV